jgi:hypothetical protein
MPRNGCGIAAQPENNDWLVVNQLSAELAFYDALETSDAAGKMMGDDALRSIARELVVEVHRNVTIDWAVKESARAETARAGQARAAPLRLPARKAGAGHLHRTNPGRGAELRVGRRGHRLAQSKGSP